MGLSDTFSRVPTWGWAVGGVLVVGAVLLMTKGGSGSANVSSNATPSTDVNDILSQLQDAANNLGTTAGTATKTITQTKTIKSKSYWGSDIPAALRVFSSESAVTLFKKYGVKFGTTINMSDLRALLKKMKINYGKTVDAADLIKAGIIKEPPVTESTSSSTVQSSNNEVTP